MLSQTPAVLEWESMCLGREQQLFAVRYLIGIRKCCTTGSPIDAACTAQGHLIRRFCSISQDAEEQSGNLSSCCTLQGPFLADKPIASPWPATRVDCT